MVNGGEAKAEKKYFVCAVLYEGAGGVAGACSMIISPGFPRDVRMILAMNR